MCAALGHERPRRKARVSHAPFAALTCGGGMLSCRLLLLLVPAADAFRSSPFAAAAASPCFAPKISFLRLFALLRARAAARPLTRSLACLLACLILSRRSFYASSSDSGRGRSRQDGDDDNDEAECWRVAELSSKKYAACRDAFKTSKLTRSLFAPHIL